MVTANTIPKLEAPCEICGKVIKASSKKRLVSAMMAHVTKHKAVTPSAPSLDAILNHPLVQGILSKVGTLETTVAQLTENNSKITEAMSALVKSNNAMQEELTPIVQAVHSAQSQQPPQQSPNQSILGFSLSPEIQKTLADALIKRLLGGGGGDFNPEAFRKQAEMLDSLARAVEGPKLRAMQEITTTLKLYTSAGLTTEKAIDAAHANIAARLAPEGGVR